MVNSQTQSELVDIDIFRSYNHWIDFARLHSSINQVNITDLI